MGTVAIPAARLLAAHALNLKVAFAFSVDGVAPSAGGVPLEIDPIVVFSPAMYLPAVIAQAEALAKFVFDSSDVLGVRRTPNDLGLLGVEADVMAVDGSPQGILRGLLLTRASEQLFEMNLSANNPQTIDLARVTAYYRGEGAPALRGECFDVMTADVSDYEWS